jgi:CRP-like cAMP-binding protein
VVRLTDASGIPYTYMVWVHLKNYPSMFRAREELYREIHRALQQAGIEIAPQIQELRTRRARVTAAEPPSIQLALRSLDLAGVLTEQELEQIAESSEYRHFNAEHIIVAEGTVSDAFYIITGGLVDSVVKLQDGTPKVVETLGPGQHFGITTMLTTEPSFIEFTAKSDVTVICVGLDCLRAIIGARPDLAAQLADAIKQRLDAAEAARIASRRPVRRLSLRDIRRGMEQRIRSRREIPS